MGSTRFYGKVLAPFGNDSLLGWILKRLERLPWQVIVATTIETKDDAIENFCIKNRVSYYRGNELDVLDRYYRCALANGIPNIIRLTADNPFPDIEMLKKLANVHIEQDCDYTHSFGHLPVGVGAEIFKFEALKRSWKNGLMPHHREHVNEYILENPSQFSISTISVPTEKNAPNISLTIDTEFDYYRIKRLVIDNNLLISTEDLIRQIS